MRRELRAVGVLERGGEGGSDGGDEGGVEGGEVGKGFPDDRLLERELVFVGDGLVLRGRRSDLEFVWSEARERTWQPEQTLSRSKVSIRFGPQQGKDVPKVLALHTVSKLLPRRL